MLLVWCFDNTHINIMQLRMATESMEVSLGFVPSTLGGAISCCALNAIPYRPILKPPDSISFEFNLRVKTATDQ